MNYRSPLLTLSLLALAFACSKQGEGERCSKLNNNDDCDTNLACIAANLNSCSAPNAESATCNPDLCCPPAPQVSRIDKCNEYQFGSRASSGTGGASAASSGTGGSAVGGESSVAETGGSAVGGESSVAETGGSAAAGTGGSSSISTDAGLDAG